VVTARLSIPDTTFWQLEVCNACRYCEGYCAVFPAMELRSTFSQGDLVYLANLCHDCRACFYACMYAPPHEFGVNIPKALAEVRERTYADYALPRVVSDLARRNALLLGAATLVGLAFFVGVAAVGGEGFFGVHTGPGASTSSVPYRARILPALPSPSKASGLLCAARFAFPRARAGTVGEPLPTSVGQDSYQRIFGRGLPTSPADKPLPAEVAVRRARYPLSRAMRLAPSAVSAADGLYPFWFLTTEANNAR